MSITATELEILKIMKDKNDMISMTELSAKAGFEKGCVGFFTRSSCRITAKGKISAA